MLVTVTLLAVSAKRHTGQRRSRSRAIQALRVLGAILRIVEGREALAAVVVDCTTSSPLPIPFLWEAAWGFASKLLDAAQNILRKTECMCAGESIPSSSSFDITLVHS